MPSTDMVALTHTHTCNPWPAGLHAPRGYPAALTNSQIPAVVPAMLAPQPLVPGDSCRYQFSLVTHPPAHPATQPPSHPRLRTPPPSHTGSTHHRSPTPHPPRQVPAPLGTAWYCLVLLGTAGYCLGTTRLWYAGHGRRHLLLAEAVKVVAHIKGLRRVRHLGGPGRRKAPLPAQPCHNHDA